MKIFSLFVLSVTIFSLFSGCVRRGEIENYSDKIGTIGFSYPCKQNYQEVILDKPVALLLKAVYNGDVSFSEEENTTLVSREITVRIYAVTPELFADNKNKERSECDLVQKEELEKMVLVSVSEQTLTFIPMQDKALLKLPITDRGVYYVVFSSDKGEIGVFLNIVDPVMERYEDRKNGYSFELPKSWGAIQPFGNSFVDDLYEDFETIGPDLSGTGIENGDDYYSMDVSVFSDGNSSRENDQSWINFYRNYRFEYDKNYTLVSLENTRYLTVETVDFDDETGEYLRTCRLMENKNKLYVFCSHRGNMLHERILRSVEFT